MIGTKKKIIYSFLTLPLAYMTVKAYFWQCRRKLEKIEEVKTRGKKLNEIAVRLNDETLRNLQMNEEWEFKPVELVGYFDNDKRLLINKTKDATPGFHVVTSFYCYKDETGKDQPLLVDRGWIPYEYKLDEFNNDNKQMTKIKGVFYKGDKINNFTFKSEDSKDAVQNKLFYMNPQELAKHLLLNNALASQLLIKIVNFENNSAHNKKQYPETMHVNDLMMWTITPRTHQAYASFWFFVSFLNIVSNIFVWTM